MRLLTMTDYKEDDFKLRCKTLDQTDSIKNLSPPSNKQNRVINPKNVIFFNPTMMKPIEKRDHISSTEQTNLN